MKKCRNHHKYSRLKAKVYVCPDCWKILDAEGLFKLLDDLEFSKKVKAIIKMELKRLNFIRSA